MQRQVRKQSARTHLLSELCSTCFGEFPCLDFQEKVNFPHSRSIETLLEKVEQKRVRTSFQNLTVCHQKEISSSQPRQQRNDYSLGGESKEEKLKAIVWAKN